ncbi:hypothetical protein TEA_008718 [Camellia sinensis var. sinensis]|uniref:Uncharacterized protein n=1 Tax=Camellia sinensis var. sinensis TaxID=542762 RepID=A0A4S4E234_CAMSN|nr:hypothetical protein TEA_008718 [Camellia sinensis var. sinensis]
MNLFRTFIVVFLSSHGVVIAEETSTHCHCKRSVGAPYGVDGGSSVILLSLLTSLRISLLKNIRAIAMPFPSLPSTFLTDMDIMERHLSKHIDVTLHLLLIRLEGLLYHVSPQIENGDKIIMPPSALDRLASLHIDYPMLFELHNAATERMSHCGVLEFIAEEGMIYMPYWMMENLLLQEGDIVRVKNVTLPKGTYVRLQPHTKDFLDISNPKAILETTLRNFSCLTTGDSIMVAYNNKKYYIDIIETKPSNAISIIETDCEVDFAPPLDYKEPEKPVATVPSGKAPAGGEEVPAETEPKFNPFTGAGRRLDGKPLKYEPPPVSSSSGSKDKRPDVASGGGQPSTGSSSQGTAKEPKQEEPSKKDEPKFQPFTGKKYSLKG